LAVTYHEAGVDLHAADVSTKAIASLAKTTFDKNVLKDVGLFAGFYQLDLAKYSNPVLVSSIDGVGTKLKIAFMMNSHDSVGQDLVNHCVNDIMTTGADPLFFLDYIGTQKLEPQIAAQIVSGMARACRENHCALIGGETAEMPGFYSSGEYDLAGAIVGVVDRNKIVDGARIQPGDRLIGLPSTGLHTNGYSLARKILFDVAQLKAEEYQAELRCNWGEVLLRIHRSYSQSIKAIRDLPGLVGISHITGGGIEGNTKRLLGPGLELKIEWDNWEIPAVFRLLQSLGNVSDVEMRRVFNVGIGMVFVVRSQDSETALTVLRENGEKPVEIGTVIALE
jgi:phosphoribosylformylglycinamidine cyclo-ligase